jgi:hypothetical protein
VQALAKKNWGGQLIAINCNTIGPIINWSGILPFTNTNKIAINCNYNWSNRYLPIPIKLQLIAIIIGPSVITVIHTP